MKFNKSICSVVSGIMAASMLCLPAYAAEDNNTKIPSLEEVMSVEQASVKVEDGVIAYVPDKTQEGSFSESNKQIPVKPAYYPYEIQYEDHHGKPVIIKSFRVPAEYNPHELIEESFEEDGYRYIQQDILMDAPVKFFEEKVVAEPITFSTKDNKAETLKAALEPVLEYNEGGFQGQLTIDYDSIISTPADESTYSYPIVKTKEFNNLESNDYAYIRKQMNGLTLKNVDWEVQTGADDRIPDLYTAYATYEGTGYGKKINEYTNTAFYTGTVSREVNGDKICSIIYKGEREFPWGAIMLVTAGAAMAGGVVTTVMKKKDHEAKKGDVENA